jgi:hypothetical protein
MFLEYGSSAEGECVVAVTEAKLVFLKSVWAVLHVNLTDENLKSCTGCLATYTDERDANRAILDNKRRDLNETHEISPELFPQIPNDLSDSEVEVLWDDYCAGNNLYKVERVGLFHLSSSGMPEGTML